MLGALDGAGGFIEQRPATGKAAAVKDFVADTAIELTYFLRRSLQLNPSEECWQQFKQFLANRSFDGLPNLEIRYIQRF